MVKSSLCFCNLSCWIWDSFMILRFEYISVCWGIKTKVPGSSLTGDICRGSWNCDACSSMVGFAAACLNCLHQLVVDNFPWSYLCCYHIKIPCDGLAGKTTWNGKWSFVLYNASCPPCDHLQMETYLPSAFRFLLFSLLIHSDWEMWCLVCLVWLIPSSLVIVTVMIKEKCPLASYKG